MHNSTSSYVLGGRYETTGVHHAARWRGGVAAGGARATAGEAADNRVSRRNHARDLEPVCYRFRGTAPRTWLDRGSYYLDRLSRGGGQHRARRRDRSRIRPTQG